MIDAPPWRWSAAALLVLLVAACASVPKHVARAAPPPARERVFAVAVDTAVAASIAALVRLGFAPAEVDGARGTIVSHFRPVGEGGVIRLVIGLAAPAPGRIRVRVHSERLATGASRVDTGDALEESFFGTLVAEIARAGLPRSRLAAPFLEA